MSSAERLTEHEMRSRSLLPGWSIGHVLTHLARNADAYARRLAGALNGEDVPKYAHGEEQRRREIADGAQRPFKQIIADLRTSISQLEGVFVASAAAGWPNGHFLVESTTVRQAAGRTGCAKWKCTMSTSDLDTRLWTGRMNTSPGICRYCCPAFQRESVHPPNDARLWRRLPDADRWTRKLPWLHGEPQPTR